MFYQGFLIKYAEIAIKGKNRGLFEDALIRQMKFALADVDGDRVVEEGGGGVVVFAERRAVRCHQVLLR